MSGSQHSAIDFTWLLENLEIANVPVGVDDEKVDDVPTFVIGPKAIHAAEAYVLGLFQLYPTVYFHKATRGAEKLFSELLVRAVKLVQDGSDDKVGLPGNHPLIQFAKAPEDISTALSLDDTVIWGALSQLVDSDDELISRFAKRLRDRKLYKCLDIRAAVQHQMDPKNTGSEEVSERIDKCCARIIVKLQDLKEKNKSDVGVPQMLFDEASRSPYKTGGGSSGPVERINVRTEGGSLMDLKQQSDVVSGLREFKLTRAYYDRDHPNVEAEVRRLIQGEVEACR